MLQAVAEAGGSDNGGAAGVVQEAAIKLLAGIESLSSVLLLPELAAAAATGAGLEGLQVKQGLRHAHDSPSSCEPLPPYTSLTDLPYPFSKQPFLDTYTLCLPALAKRCMNKQQGYSIPPFFLSVSL